MKRELRLSLRIQVVLCALVICGVVFAFANFATGGMVKDKGVNGMGNSGDGGHANDDLPEGSYRAPAADKSPMDFSKIDVFKTAFTYLMGKKPNKKPSPPPDPTLIPTSVPTVVTYGSQSSGNIKYAQSSYNMAPVIQMNQSWKRASKLEPITFDAGSTYDPDGYIVAYEWTFGDGSMATGKTVEHAYKEEGKYSVKLRAVDNNGVERAGYVTAIISNKPPVAVPGNDTNVTAGETVWFNGTGSYDPDGRVVAYEWTFGDGTSAKGESVSHAYARPDKYKAELKVTDDSGANGTAYRAVNVAGASATPVQASSGGPQGVILLAGAGIACVAVIFLTRKKGK